MEFLNVLKVSLRLLYESSIRGGSTWFSGVVCQPHAPGVHPVSTGWFLRLFSSSKIFLNGISFLLMARLSRKKGLVLAAPLSPLSNGISMHIFYTHQSSLIELIHKWKTRNCSICGKLKKRVKNERPTTLICRQQPLSDLRPTNALRI